MTSCPVEIVIVCAQAWGTQGQIQGNAITGQIHAQ